MVESCQNALEALNYSDVPVHFGNSTAEFGKPVMHSGDYCLLKCSGLRTQGVAGVAGQGIDSASADDVLSRLS